jgi:hypothetical protein
MTTNFKEAALKEDLRGYGGRFSDNERFVFE